jgi:hypothetical protein
VRARRTEIEKTINALKAEDNELAIAEKVLLRLATTARAESASVQPGSAKLQEPAASEEESTLVKTVRAELKGNETLKELIVLLLDTCTEDWWTANEIKDHLSDATGRDIPISSISPTLTVMKDAGILVRTGHNVALASRIPQGQEEKQ